MIPLNLYNSHRGLSNSNGYGNNFFCLKIRTTLFGAGWFGMEFFLWVELLDWKRSFCVVLYEAFEVTALFWIKVLEGDAAAPDRDKVVL